MSFPECGLCDGMRICSCKSEPIDKRFIAACHAMQSFLTEEYYGKMDEHASFTAKRAVQYADVLIAELEKK